MRHRRASFARKLSYGLRSEPLRWFAVIICVIISVGTCCVWQRLRLISMGYELRRLSLQESDLARANVRYKAEVAKLEAPGRIEAIAPNQLGMVRPLSWQLVSFRMENPVPPPKPDEKPPLPDTRESAEGFSPMAKLLD